VPESRETQRETLAYVGQTMTRAFDQHLTADELDLVLENGVTESVRAHLTTCPDCSRLVAADRQLVHELSRLALHVPSVGFEDRVMAAVRVTEPLTATAAMRRRVFSTRRSLLTAATLVLGLIGSMGASVAWSLAHRDALLAFGHALKDGASRVVWTTVQSLATSLIEQPWYAGVRGVLDTPERLAFALGAVVIGWLGGMLLLRRLIALPDHRVAHESF
jgi:anti-sigma factor RsiW